MIYSHQLDRTVAEVLEHVVATAMDDGLAPGDPAQLKGRRTGDVKFFLDTADIAEIEEAASWGVLAGVTTNPTLYSRVGGKLVRLPRPPQAHLRDRATARSAARPSA